MWRSVWVCFPRVIFHLLKICISQMWLHLDFFFFFAKYNLYLMNINKPMPGRWHDARPCDNSNVKKCLTGENTITFFRLWAVQSIFINMNNSLPELDRPGLLEDTGTPKKKRKKGKKEKVNGWSDYSEARLSASLKWLCDCKYCLDETANLVALS